MTKSKALNCRQRFVSIVILLIGTCLLSINIEQVHTAIGYSQDPPSRLVQHRGDGFDWMDTSGVTLSRVVGDPATCTDVIYTGDSRDPFQTSRSDSQEIIYKQWKAIAHVVHSSLPNTCFVFFDIASPWIDPIGRELHPVWGRLPATALVLEAFPKADIFLYMDSDAILNFGTKSPTEMYTELAFDGYGDEATMQHLEPGLIVNKPLKGWLCGQCEKYGLGHGCFNSGVLIWHRDRAEPVLKAWWESRNTDNLDNFFAMDDPEDKGFYGWDSDSEDNRLGNKMGEQNRLMYVFGTDPSVRQAVWPVPRQKNNDNDSISCPGTVDEKHVPCLQNDISYSVRWHSKLPACFVGHFTDQKAQLKEQAQTILDNGSRLRA